MLPILRPALMHIQAMGTAAIAALPQFLLGLLLFAVFVRVARWGRDWTRRVLSISGKQDAAPVIGQLAYGTLLAAGVAVAAAVMGVGLGHVLAGVGVSGVVVGFAFKDILENYLAGILLMLARPFHVGDDIKTGDYEGTVQVVSTRSTTMQTFDGQLVVIPNAKIYSLPLVNLSALGARRSTIPMRLGLGRDVAEVRKTVLAIATRNDRVLDSPPPAVVATGLDASGIGLELTFWSHSADAATAKGQVVEAISRQIYQQSPPPPVVA